MPNSYTKVGCSKILIMQRMGLKAAARKLSVLQRFFIAQLLKKKHQTAKVEIDLKLRQVFCCFVYLKQLIDALETRLVADKTPAASAFVENWKYGP